MPPYRSFHRPLRLALILAVLLAGTGLPAAGPIVAGAADPPPPAFMSKVDPLVLSQTAGGGQADFLVVLADQAGLSGAAALPSKIEKGRYVYHTLLAKAQGTQGPLIAWLQSQPVAYQSFYIVNMLWVKGSADVVQALAARPEVAHIRANPLMKGVESQPVMPSAPAPAGIEPNVTYIHADQLWNLGFTGQGIVIGSGDTGIQWDHPALKPRYRGWNGVTADHNDNWHDSIHTSSGVCGQDAPAPCDDFGHGTHTIGTAVGDDGVGNQIGVAPGAKWIGCRNMDDGNGTPARYIECFQFFLAPYPLTGTVADGNPDLAPDVTTNSWTCPTGEGCTGDGNEILAAVQAQQAAGIMTVVAAGNAGSGCNTVNEPPATYGEAYTVGALDTGTDNIASFSSRGPVTLDGSNRRKPDITAPGNPVRSSEPITFGGPYGYLSGTSMATPDVAGAVALLWSAVPSLRGQVTMTEQILNDSAVHLDSSDCGSSGSPNNTFGYGRLDVKAAYDLAKPPPAVSIQLPLMLRNYINYFAGPFEVEPNNTAAQANGPLQSGVDYHGYQNDAKDYFSINLLNSGTITLDLTNTSGQGTQLLLYYQAADVPHRVSFIANAPFHIALTNQPSGWYYIEVFTAGGLNQAMPYTIRAVYP